MCKKCIEIILPVSKAGNWRDAEDEWINGNEYKYEKGRCICNQIISYHYKIRNIEKKKCYWVGSTCIETIFKHNPKKIKSILFKTCEICNKSIKKKDFKKHQLSSRHMELHIMYVKRKDREKREKEKYEQIRLYREQKKKKRDEQRRLDYEQKRLDIELEEKGLLSCYKCKYIFEITLENPCDDCPKCGA